MTWKPGRGAFYPVDCNGVVTLNHVISRNEDGEVDQFCGKLIGRGWHQQNPSQHFVLAWRKEGAASFVLYLWGGGHQERIGTVKPEFVLGLDSPVSI